MHIPFNKPYIGSVELSSAKRVLNSGRIGGNGRIGKAFESLMRRSLGVNHVLLTTSCTHALEMALDVLGVKKGDEVILPSFNFVSAANAVMKVNAKPVFIDVDGDTLNIGTPHIKSALRARTRAVICVHYAGVPCDMGPIMRLARKSGIFVVEDAAQAVGSRYNGRYAGTLGDIGCVSFHETKNITCGEGGAFLTGSGVFARRAEIIREKGTDRSAFLRGEVDKYTWRGVGSSFVLSELLVAIGMEQFKRMNEIIAKRKKIGLRYIRDIRILEKEGRIRLPRVPDKGYNWHMVYFFVNDARARGALISRLRKAGVEAASHFVPLHLSPFARDRFHYRKGDFPVTERASSTLVRLPLYPGLTAGQQDYVRSTLLRLARKYT